MTDIEKELRYYRRRVEDLGKRLIASEDNRRQAQIEADRASRSLALLREAHELVDIEGSQKAFSKRCLQKIASISLSDGVAVLRLSDNGQTLEPEICFGLLDGAMATLPLTEPPAAYAFYNDRYRNSPLLKAVAEQTGFRHFAWAWNARRGRGLLAMRRFLSGPHRPFSDADRGVTESALTIFDEVSRRRQMHESLIAAKIAAENANLAKSRFLAMMSHELRTPLNAVLGFSDMIRSDLTPPPHNPQTSQYAEMIHSSGTQLLQIITDILDVAQLGGDDLELRESRVRIDELVNRCAEQVRPRAGEKAIDINVDITTSRTYLLVDEKRINQAVTNVLDNALKFTRRGGSVRLAVSGCNGSGLHIHIADTGQGMTQADIARAFEPFGLLDSEPSRTPNGVGLGLPLSRIFVERHGGALTVDSEPDQGTRVCITIPSDRVL